MLTPIRRVVTGHDNEGRAIIVSDEKVETVFEVPIWPGRGVTAIWTANEGPVSNREKMLHYPAASLPRGLAVSVL